MCQGAPSLAKELSLCIFAHGDNGLVTRGTALDRRSSAPAAFQQWSTECQYVMHGTWPWICTTDLRIRILFRILLFLSVADKMPTLKFFFYIVLLNTFWGYIYLSLQREKSKTSHKLVKSRLFYMVLFVGRRIRICTITDRYGSGGPKTYWYGSTTLVSSNYSNNSYSLENKI